MKYYIREQGETTEECIEAHWGNYFETPDEAVSAAARNVSPGAKWAIIDKTGKVVARSEPKAKGEK